MAGTVTVDTIQSGLSTPTVFKNTSGTEIGQLCRSWINYTPGASPTIKTSFNSSSITRGGTGFYTVTMTNALSDANYSCTSCASSAPAGPVYCIVTVFSNLSAARVAPTTTTYNSSTWNASTLYDCGDTMHMVIR
jgi:hypothetical protein